MMTTKMFMTALALGALLALGTNANADVVAQWGAPGGTATIVAASQPFLAPANYTTYSAGTAINPAVGVDYYSSAAGRTPVFNGAFSETLSSGQIFNAGSGRDQIQASSGTSTATTFTGAVIFENLLLPSSGALQSLNSSRYRFTGANTTAGQTRFLFQAQNNNWYVSDSQGMGTAFADHNIADVTAISWFDFTQFSGGVSTVGTTAVTPDFVNVKKVGMYFDITKNTGASGGFATEYFQANAAAVPEPSACGILGLFGLGLLRRKKA